MNIDYFISLMNINIMVHINVLCIASVMSVHALLCCVIDDMHTCNNIYNPCVY